MNYRTFGTTSLLVSEIGFGAWAIGGNAMVGDTPIGWGAANDEVSTQAIHAALGRGINFFDTADFYGLGHSEALLGKVLEGNSQALIATKVGHRDIDSKIVLDYSRDYIKEACHASLGRLKRDCIDYYQLHSARMPHLLQGDCIRAMEELQQEGKIRYWGLSLNSFEPAPEAEFLIRHHKGAGFQLVFNLVNQVALPVMELAHANGFGVIARMPLQFGLLTGKFTRNTSFSADDHRSFRLNAAVLSDALDILEQQVWPLCERYGTTQTGLALSFILSYPAVSTVIPGIRTAAHAHDNTSGIVQLEAADKQLLEELFTSRWKPIVDVMQSLG